MTGTERAALSTSSAPPREQSGDGRTEQEQRRCFRHRQGRSGEGRQFCSHGPVFEEVRSVHTDGDLTKIERRQIDSASLVQHVQPSPGKVEDVQVRESILSRACQRSFQVEFVPPVVGTGSIAADREAGVRRSEAVAIEPGRPQLEIYDAVVAGRVPRT